MSGAGITTETLACAYELLRGTKPFSRWKMPPASEIKFRLSRSRHATAQLTLPKDGRKPIIEVSIHCVSTLPPLLMAMAHEMAHLQEHLSGDMREDCKHGAAYRRRANAICNAHRFDPQQFGWF